MPNPNTTHDHSTTNNSLELDRSTIHEIETDRQCTYYLREPFPPQNEYSWTTWFSSASSGWVVSSDLVVNTVPQKKRFGIVDFCKKFYKDYKGD